MDKKTPYVMTGIERQISEIENDTIKSHIVLLIAEKTCVTLERFHACFGTFFHSTISDMIESNELVKNVNILQLSDISSKALFNITQGKLPE